MGIEPTSEAWEASILPLYDARSVPVNSIHNYSLGATAAFTKGKDSVRVATRHLEFSSFFIFLTCMS